MQTIQSLAFDDIKANFIEHLKDPAYGTAFRDYNFNASGISTLINLLAYNTHFLGYYVKMLLNESFVDSARLMESMTSHSKLVGYTHKGVKASRAELYVTTEWMTPQQEPTTLSVLIPAGTTFTATTAQNLQRTFTTTDDFILYKRAGGTGDYAGLVRYVNEIDPLTPLVVYEGSHEQWKFIVPADPNPRFIIKEKGVDYNTIQVKVHESEGTSEFTPFTLASSAIGITGESQVFYITTNEDGFYEIFFGNGVFGKNVRTGNMIVVSYVLTSGSSGNGAGKNSEWGNAVAPAEVVNATPIKIDTNYNKTWMISAGGLDEETVSEMRFSIPNHYRRQNRLVTAEDYRSIILSEYRNIDSINVWGGETALKKEYGKVFISVKPKFSDALSASVKKEITNNLLKRYGVIGIDPVFVDPDYLFLDLDVSVNYDKSKTSLGLSQIGTLVKTAILDYNTSQLGVFDSWYSEVTAMSLAKAADSSIKTAYAFKTMKKLTSISYTNQPEVTILFGNPIRPGIKTNSFIYGATECTITDNISDNKLYVTAVNGGARIISASIGSIDYTSGIITVKPPSAISMTGLYDKGTTGTLEITVRPLNPDIRAFMNNIIKILAITVTVNQSA